MFKKKDCHDFTRQALWDVLDVLDVLQALKIIFPLWVSRSGRENGL